MQPSETDHLARGLRQAWPVVCKTRGTLAPDGQNVAAFISGLSEQSLHQLAHALSKCAEGRENGNQMELVSWAAHCTKSALLEKLASNGIVCSPSSLFAVGARLMDQGWDITGRIAQLKNCPPDVATLQSELASQDCSDDDVASQPQDCTAQQQKESEPDAPRHIEGELHLKRAENVSLFSGSKDSRVHVQASAGPAIALSAIPLVAIPLVAIPLINLASEVCPPSSPHQPAAPSPHTVVSSLQAAALEPGRLQLRLFGKKASHTLEIGPHRRSKDFLGCHVVSIESALATGDGSFDWIRKMAFQLTPEEMPLALAVLMRLRDGATFSNHGKDHRKFLELRWQDSGLVVVTGDGLVIHAVPVPFETVYHLLKLFCTAMAQGVCSTSVAETMALVRETFAHRF